MRMNDDNRFTGKEVTDCELKTILVEIMCAVDEFCRANDLCYYVLGGTALGAVRHKGFIPWDDDIDIGLPRKDYERFCSTFSVPNSNYKVVCVNNSKDYYLPSAKVIDTRISLFEEISESCEIGAYVDVFPLDYVEKNEKGTCQFFSKKIRNNIESLRYVKLKKERSLPKNLLIFASRVICPVSLHSLACMKEDRAKKYSMEKDTGWLANLHGAWKEKEIVKSEYFGKGKDYQFENLTVRGPENYDGYLSSLYGNYMELPPVEKQVSHHRFTAIWK